MPAGVCGIEASRAGFLASNPQIVQPRNGLALKRGRAIGGKFGDDPGMGQGIRRHRAGALADEQLKPGATVFGGGKRHPIGRQHRDIAAVAALIEYAEPPALARTGAEIERMLDDLAKTRGLDRK